MSRSGSSLLSLFLVLSAASLLGCEKSDPVAVTADDAFGGGGETSVEVILASTSAQPVDGDESAGLVTMREEEKVARDVYTALYARWQSPVFANIAASEQKHMDAVLALLRRYGIADPVGSHPAGEFTDPAMQQLYETLVTQGSASLAEAYTVGAMIEDLDIADLQRHLGETDNTDITRVYQNLERGSRNHMRAFVKSLASNGASYTPQYISQAEFDAIVASGTERGRGW